MDEHEPIRECLEFRIKHEQAHSDRDKRIDDHIKESDCIGGYRDRVGELERSMRLVPYVTAACAFCGGLVAQIVPQIGVALADFIGRIG